MDPEARLHHQKQIRSFSPLVSMPTSENLKFMRVWRTILGFVEMYLTGGQPVSEVPDKPTVPSGHPGEDQSLSNLAGHYREKHSRRLI